MCKLNNLLYIYDISTHILKKDFRDLVRFIELLLHHSLKHNLKEIRLKVQY